MAGARTVRYLLFTLTTIREGEDSSRQQGPEARETAARRTYVRNTYVNVIVGYSTAPSEPDRSPRAPGSLCLCVSSVSRAYSRICSRHTRAERGARARADEAR
jgi:hypothetical protein